MAPHQSRERPGSSKNTASEVKPPSGPRTGTVAPPPNQLDLPERLLLELVDWIADRIKNRLATPPPLHNSRLLTVEQAATYLGRTANAVRHLLAKKVLQAVRLDGRIFIDIRDLDQVIERAKR